MIVDCDMALIMLTLTVVLMLMLVLVLVLSTMCMVIFMADGNHVMVVMTLTSRFGAGLFVPCTAS